MKRDSSRRARDPGRAVILVACLALLAPLASAGADDAATPACAVEIAGRVQRYYDSVQDIRAEFQQVTRSVTLGNAALGADAPSRGSVQLAKPGRMRWVYESPVASQVVSDGSTLWIYDVTGAQVQRFPVQPGTLNSTALEFLLGDGKLVEAFAVSTDTCAADANGQIDLNLVPNTSANYERLGMRVDFESGELVESVLVDLFGNETRIRFANVQTNLAPSAESFAFVVPDGVDLIDYQDLR